MTRKLFAFALSVAVVSAAVADDKPAPKDVVKEKAKDVKLEGKLVCTKCELQETKACGHCLIVTEKKGKKETEVKYYLKDDGAKEQYHSQICTEPKKAKVTGKLTEEKVTVKDPVGDKKEQTRKVVSGAKVEFVK